MERQQMSRPQRLRTIVEIVSTKKIRSQAELAEALRKAGHKVTQPTLSRDIAELGLVKSATGYSLPEQAEQPKVSDTELRTAVQRFALDVYVSSNLVMVKTLAGSASMVAWALDRSGWDEMVGTIAGDDTILLMAKTNGGAGALCKRIRELLGA
jgi:transcriptional regulator of arginine metabolism